MNEIENAVRPIIGIENRTPQEVFDIMCDRIKRTSAAIAAMREWVDAENQRLRGEVDALREDCRKLLENEPVATCESCGTWLLDGDDYVTDPDGVAGCWASMTDVQSKTERQCYAYRVGKCDARQHLSDNAEAIAPGE